jgi:hypothetical protein
MDAEERYRWLMNNDPLFEEKRRKLAEVIEEEGKPSHPYEWDHAAFLDGYSRIEKRFFNKFDPHDEGLVERARRGDRDASEMMLIRSGVADSLKSSE